jgi:hypothetical protein
MRPIWLLKRNWMRSKVQVIARGEGLIKGLGAMLGMSDRVGVFIEVYRCSNQEGLKIALAGCFHQMTPRTCRVLARAMW